MKTSSIKNFTGILAAAVLVYLGVRGGRMTLLWIAAGLIGLVFAAHAFRACQNAAYRRSGLLPAAGQATMADVERLVRAGRRILAMRCYIEIHHCGTAEASKAV